MGFFDTAFNIVRRVAGVVLGGAPAAARAALPVATRGPRSIAPVVAAAAGGAATATFVNPISGLPDPAAIARAAALAVTKSARETGEMALSIGGNGREVTTTVVTTVDKDGNVLRVKTLKGSPFLMNRDLAIARRVDRVLGKAARKNAARRRGPSTSSQIMSAIQQKALSQALGVGCPPPPCPS